MILRYGYWNGWKMRKDTAYVPDEKANKETAEIFLYDMWSRYDDYGSFRECLKNAFSKYEKE